MFSSGIPLKTLSRGACVTFRSSKIALLYYVQYKCNKRYNRYKCDNCDNCDKLRFTLLLIQESSLAGLPYYFSFLEAFFIFIRKNLYERYTRMTYEK